ncbi:MAG: cyclopropane-fatty-acyl-phospholipid synthase family protein [Wenzhouxiangellaceae bacterium]
MAALIDLAERGLLPDSLIRYGMRRLMRNRLQAHYADGIEAQTQAYRELLQELRQSPVAIETDAANEQHYMVPTDFFKLVLGKHLKYSCALWPDGVSDLDQAEQAMLQLYGQRAGLADGQNILELGCGWGSLTLWMAANYPGAHITAVSNSSSQREHIEAQARARGLDNVQILTADVNHFTPPQQDYDRIVSIEMFEHMRNYQTLLQRVASWLADDGRLFVHIFCHHRLMYPFETEGEHNWMGKYFFTGGLMPALDTLLHFQQDLLLEDLWAVDGRHYEKTSNAWLALLDQRSAEVLEVCRQTYGDAQAKIWRQRWRMFFMACAELFGMHHGREWLVGHYLFSKRS